MSTVINDIENRWRPLKKKKTPLNLTTDFFLFWTSAFSFFKDTALFSVIKTPDKLLDGEAPSGSVVTFLERVRKCHLGMRLWWAFTLHISWVAFYSGPSNLPLDAFLRVGDLAELIWFKLGASFSSRAPRVVSRCFGSVGRVCRGLNH